MRTTVTLSKDAAAAVARLRRERGVGVSAAVNDLIGRGLVAAPEVGDFTQRTHSMGAAGDLANVWEAIETLEGPPVGPPPAT